MENPIPFLIFFITLWFFVCVGLSFASGWFRLMQQYPDTREPARLRLHSQSGIMRGVNMNRILTVSVCETGIRVGMLRIFGPFSRDFLVPWAELRVVRKKVLAQAMAELQFGEPKIGNLTLPAHVANQLARAAGSHWPETPLPEEESRLQTAMSFVKLWLIYSAIAASFFTIVPRLAHPRGHPSLVATLLFPLIAMGIVCLVQYLSRRPR